MRLILVLFALALFGCTTTSNIPSGSHGLTTGTKVLSEELLICYDSEAAKGLPSIQLLNRYVNQIARTCIGMDDRGILRTGSEVRVDALIGRKVYSLKQVTHAYAIGVANDENGEEFRFHMHLGFLPDRLRQPLWKDP